MTLDDLLGTLHDDATLRVEDRLALIERELIRRRLVSAELATSMFDHIRNLNEEILRLMPEGDHAVDHHRLVRQTLERERRALQRELREELVGRWRDLQPLRKEQRDLLDEERKRNDRYNLHMKDY